MHDALLTDQDLRIPMVMRAMASSDEIGSKKRLHSK